MSNNNSNTNESTRRSKTACWIEAMRLRTLPVSVAGVFMAMALAIMNDTFKWQQALICLIFAVLAQIASNFANEYFDYRDGLDKKGRVGPRRGVTEGDISPKAMRNAAIGTLALAAAIGCTLIWWGGWWLILVGALIILGALAYSAGPYPLSRHGWGEVAVIIFFGIAPVTLTYWLQAGECPVIVWLTAMATGLMGANVLIVNNYRDHDDDAAVGKRTIAVIFGAKTSLYLYFINGLIAVILTTPMWLRLGTGIWVQMVFLALNFFLWKQIRSKKGTALNPMLGKTAVSMLAFSIVALAGALSL